MSTGWNLTQYYQTFKPLRLGNYEVPKCNKKILNTKNIPSKGLTSFISNGQGVLLKEKLKCPRGMRTEFVATWDMPLKIPGPKSLNPTSRKKEMTEKLKKEADEYRCQMKVKSMSLKVVAKMNDCEKEKKEVEVKEKKRMDEIKKKNLDVCQMKDAEEEKVELTCPLKQKAVDEEVEGGLTKTKDVECDAECQNQKKVEECKEKRKKEAEDKEKNKKKTCDEKEMYAKCREHKDQQRADERDKKCEEKKEFDTCVDKCKVTWKDDGKCMTKMKNSCDERLQKWKCDKEVLDEKNCGQRKNEDVCLGMKQEETTCPIAPAPTTCSEAPTTAESLPCPQNAKISREENCLNF